MKHSIHHPEKMQVSFCVTYHFDIHLTAKTTITFYLFNAMITPKINTYVMKFFSLLLWCQQ